MMASQLVASMVAAVAAVAVEVEVAIALKVAPLKAVEMAA